VTRATEDYTPESLTILTQALAGTDAGLVEASGSPLGRQPVPAAASSPASPSLPPTPSPGTAARDLTVDEAVSCLERATGLTQGAEVLRLETARFQGKPAVIGVFHEPAGDGAGGAVLGLAADATTCDPLFLTRVAP
jgi:hypothetical protein